jgi:hypothetical protein
MPSYKGERESDELDWYRLAARKMAREGKPLVLVLDELGVDGITSRESARIFATNTFQAVLRNERLRYAGEIATDPDFKKEALQGLMYGAIQKMLDEGAWDKAVEGMQKLAKLSGWQGVEGQVNIFGDLTAKDFKELREKLESGKSKTATSSLLN